MHDRRSHPPEIQRKKTEAEQRAAPAGRVESSWRRGPRWDCFNPLAFIAAQSIIIVDDLSTSLCSPRPWWSLLAGASAGPAMQTGGDVTQFTPCIRMTWWGGVCTGEEGLLPPAVAVTARRRRVEAWRSVTRLLTTAAQCTRQWRNRLALRYVARWECGRTALR